jgi:hypothetical protein
MAEWVSAETNTHQDHVIAHVIGATVLAYFILDETAYLLLDIGFIWNIYLDGEMGLVPQSLAVAELEADESIKVEVRSDVDELALSDKPSLGRLIQTRNQSPILSVNFLISESLRRVRLNCEVGALLVETSLETAEIKFTEED